MLTPIIFWGAKGQAKVLHEFIRSAGYRLVALFDNALETRSPFDDVPLYHGKEGFERWIRSPAKPAETAGLVAIGGDRGAERHRLQQYMESHGVRPIVAQHPSAFVAGDVRLGPGSQVLAGSCVCAGVVLGESCIINTHSSIDHESTLGHGVHVGPGATLAGCVSVSDYSMIGAGAVVLPRVRVGRHAVVGAGAVVIRDVPERSVVVGNPAKVIRVNSSE